MHLYFPDTPSTFNVTDFKEMMGKTSSTQRQISSVCVILTVNR